jgi:hypothetical protein
MSAQTTFSRPDIGTDFVAEPKRHLPASDLTCPAAIPAEQSKSGLLGDKRFAILFAQVLRLKTCQSYL